MYLWIFVVIHNTILLFVIINIIRLFTAFLSLQLLHDQLPLLLLDVELYPQLVQRTYLSIYLLEQVLHVFILLFQNKLELLLRLHLCIAIRV